MHMPLDPLRNPPKECMRAVVAHLEPLSSKRPHSNRILKWTQITAENEDFAKGSRSVDRSAHTDETRPQAFDGRSE